MVQKYFRKHSEPYGYGIIVKLTALQTDYVLHRHEYMELEYILSGSLVNTVNGVPLTMHPGHFSMLAPGDSHRLSPLTPEVYILSLMMHPAMVRSPINEYLSTLRFPFCGVIPEEERPLIHMLMARMEAELAKRDRPGASFATYSALTVLNALTRHITESGYLPREDKATLAAIDFVAQHYREAITMADAAAAADLSPFYFSSSFKRVYGIAFTAYLNETRCAKAHALLLEKPNMTILDIALETGFGSYASFHRNFAQLYGLPPARWRTEMLEKRQNEKSELIDQVYRIGNHLRNHGYL